MELPFIGDVDKDKSVMVYDLGISSLCLASLFRRTELLDMELGMISLLRALRKVLFETGLMTSLLRERVAEVSTGCLVTTVLRRLTVRSIGSTGNLRGCAARSADTVDGAADGTDVSGNFIVAILQRCNRGLCSNSLVLGFGW